MTNSNSFFINVIRFITIIDGKYDRFILVENVVEIDTQ